MRELSPPGTPSDSDRAARREDAFRDARFGLFLHWGLYPLPAGEWRGQRMEYIGEWIMSRYRIPITEYEALASEFNPDRFDADAWVRLARRAGMRYVVFTAKHHDGFAMYHSRADRYNIVEATPFGRDPLRELAEACAAHGLGLGIYYSQSLDWHERNGGSPGPDFPSNYGMSWSNNWDFPDDPRADRARDFAEYFERKALPQIRELLTGYGPLAVFWFDTPFSITGEQAREVWRIVRECQPDCLINTRLGHGAGDIHSYGDNQIPARGRGGVGETAATLNDTWGYKHFDDNWKTPEETLSSLLTVSSRNVNYLLNVGPTAAGTFPEPAVAVLNALGDWMQQNGEAVHGTRESPFPYQMDWGWITRGKNRLYLCVAQWPTPGSPLVLNGLHHPARRAFLLADLGHDLPLTLEPLGHGDGCTVAITLPEVRPAGLVPVVALEVDGDAAAVSHRILPQGDGSIILPAYLADIDVAAREKPEVAAAAFRLGPAGERIPIFRTPQIDDAGVITDWHDTRDGLRWRFRVIEPGDYAVEVVTSAVHHNAPWHGGHRVRIEAGGQTLRAEITPDEMLSTGSARYYRQALTRCGVLRLPSSPELTLDLRADAIDERSPVGLAVVRVRLTPL
jgi:alpha-L-fucosidase